MSQDRPDGAEPTQIECLPLSTHIKPTIGRLGLFGGAFDPPHNGHVALASAAMTQAKLDALWFIPTFSPPHKASSTFSYTMRVKLLERLCQSRPFWHVSELEAQLPQPSYSLRTILAIKQLNIATELVLILGQDSLNALPKWYEWQQVVNLCTIAASPRPGYQVEQLNLADITIDAEPFAVSSSAIRARLARQESVAADIPAELHSLICEY